ncbi:MAG: ATP-binding cassette transporter 1 [Benniella sp.]|nr:MAG: ATP-binding cassette transporter 1 [Benniella sp.]
MSIWDCRADGNWGPVDPDCPADFTPCFEDGVLKLLPVAFLLLVGIPRLFRLWKRETLSHPSKNWKHIVKMIGIFLLIATSAAYLAVQNPLNRSNPLTHAAPRLQHLGIEFWASTLEILVLILAFYLAVVENKKSYLASDVLLLFWLFSFAIATVRFRTLVSNCPGGTSQILPDASLIERGFVGTRLALFLIVFVLESIRRDTRIQLDEGDHKCPEEDANIFSIISFHWVTGLMRKGYSKVLTMDDLWPLRTDDRSNFISSLFTSSWDEESKKSEPSLSRALRKSFGKPFYLAGVWKFIADVAGLVQPLLLRQLLLFLMSYNTSEPQPLHYGYLLAALMFISGLVQTASTHQYFHLCFRTGMNVRAALVTAIYRKALRLSNTARQQFTVGEIVNHMSMDTQRIQDVTTYLHVIWSAAFQVILILYLLYRTLGWATFVGLALLIAMIPLNGKVFSALHTYQKKYMEHKDVRIKLMNELLNGIRVIKLYAWEKTFLRQILATRNDLELRMLKKVGYVFGFMWFSWAATPFSVTLINFAVYTLIMKKALTTDIMFSSIALFNMIQSPLTSFSWVISSCAEARVSLGRLQKFLLSSEIDPKAIIIEDPRRQSATRDASDKYTLLAKDATYSWQKDSAPAVRDINLALKRDELLSVIGRVGSGKSSLIAALCGDLERISGEVRVRGSIAFVPQQAWIMNETLRENILFGNPYDPVYYQKTIEACCLVPDFEVLPGGDMTEIGERGINLSGGQRARVSLARAVYARADIYLLDDPLSAVDAHVGRAIFEKVFGPKGLLAGKTRILVTHQIQYLAQSTSILMLRDGRMVEQGNFQDLMKRKADVYQLVTEFGKDKHDDHEGGASSEQSPGDTTEPTEQPIDGDKNAKKKDTKNNIIAEEETQQGSVNKAVYWAYAKACSLPAIALYITLMLIAQSIQISMSLWLTYWSKSYDGDDASHEPGYYIGIYAIMGTIYSFMVFSQNLLLMVYCGLHSTRVLHEKMLKSVLRSPMVFFDTTPMGRILNRFSKDQSTIDDALPRSFAGLVQHSVNVLFIITLISFSTPMIILVIIPLAIIYVFMQQYFLATSRELRRLDSVSRSPVFAHFQETIGGVSSIRAYRQQPRFIQGNEHRLDQNLRAYYPGVAGNRWLGFNLECLGSLVIFGSAFFSVYSLARHDTVDPGLVGLSLTYALSLTQSLNWVVRMYTEVEANSVSVERIQEYIDLRPEAPEIIPDHRPPQDWPAQGRVEFKNYETRYRPGLELVLHDVNFTVQPHEKIGICGRTGAGKSSMTLSLFRIIEAARGQILVDGIDISTIGLYDVRSRFSIIPQDPVLFIGTIRSNLDPLGEIPDQELWQALEDSHLKAHVATLEGGLNATVQEGGENFSVGQRQLICLARALLRKTSLLILDEATAAIDLETDALVQKIIRQKFKDCTILTIAHRIDTVMDSDRIMVLDQGKVVEFDQPEKLLKNSKSLFYSLVRGSKKH